MCRRNTAETGDAKSVAEHNDWTGGSRKHTEYPSKVRQIVMYLSCLVVGVICMAALLTGRPSAHSSSAAPIGAVSASSRRNGETAVLANGDAPSPEQLEDLMSHSSSIFGSVTKLSLVQSKYWSDETLRNSAIQEWVQKHDVNQMPIEDPVSPFGCSLWINHRYRLMYIRIAHSASTSIMNFFGNCALKETPWCFEEVSKTNLAQSEIEKHLREYTVFTFVRNPWQRAASSYSYLNFVLRAQRTNRKVLDTRPYCNLDWSVYCKNPRAIARQCREFPECCGKDTVDAMLAHTEPQHQCLVGEDGTWAVDFIGRVEENEVDMWELLKLINSRRVYGAPPVTESAIMMHRNVQSCSATAPVKIPLADDEQLEKCSRVQKYAEYYEGSLECFDGVSQFYAEDIDMLGFGDAITRL